MLRLLVMILLSFSFCAFGQVAEPVVPSWVADLAAFVASLPNVGPIFVKIMAIAGTISAVLTVLVGAVYGLLKVPEIAARLAGKKETADKILAIAEKVLYYLKYFSMLNARKK